MSATTRRALLARGSAAAGAAALPALLLAAPALAQETEETGELERLVELEHAAELAYSLAGERLDGEAARLLDQLAGHSAERAAALGEALEQLGVDAPAAADDPGEYDVLADFDQRAAEERQLLFLAGLEEELVTAYEEATPQLDASQLAVTAAQVGAAHAQALVALRLLAGVGAAEVAGLPAAAE